MNVLIVSPFFRPNLGGVETYLEDLCRYLRKKHNVFVVTYQPLTTKAKGQKLEKRHNLEIRRIQWCGCGFLHKLEKRPILQMLYLGAPLFLFTFFYILRHFRKIDVLHAHGLVAAAVVKVFSKLFKIRSVCSLHYTYNFGREPLMKRFALFILSSFDVVLTFSDVARQRCLSIGLPNTKVKISHHWVNQAFFRPLPREECRRFFGINEGFVVLFVGRLLPKKGVLCLIDAILPLEQDVTCLIAGDGPLAPQIAEIANAHQNVKFFGRVSDEHLVKLYNAADVVIIPSLCEGDEGMRVLIEALSCGRPVVVSNVGSFLSLVDESVGILVKPTVENLRKVIRDLSKQPDKIRYLSLNAREYACRNFSEKNAEVIEKSYFF